MSRAPHEILIRPIVTEETSRLQFNPGRIRKRHAEKDLPVRPRIAFVVTLFVFIHGVVISRI